MEKINLKTKKNLLENIILSISVIFIYVLHTSCDIVKINGIMPVGIFAVSIYIAMFKNFVTMSIYSFISGIFFDMATGGLLGSGAIFFVVFCALIHLATLYYMRSNLFSFLIFEMLMLISEYMVIWMIEENANFLYFKLVVLTGFLKSMLTILIFSPFLYLGFAYSRKKWLGINDFQLD